MEEAKVRTFAVWIHIPVTGERARLTEIIAPDIITAQQRIADQLMNERPDVCPSVEVGGVSTKSSVATIRWRSIEVHIVGEDTVAYEATLITTLLKVPKP